MIEFRVKRKKITDIVERWCVTTRVTPMLRDYDIPGLVSQILNEFFPLHLTCGHQVDDMREVFTLESTEQQRDGTVARVSRAVCRDCKAEADSEERTKRNVERDSPRGTTCGESKGDEAPRELGEVADPVQVPSCQDNS